jgi:cell division protein FtsZ
LMAVGTASGEDRARKAAEAAISSNLLDVTIDGARGILFNVTGGPDMSLFEVNEAAAIIKETSHNDVNLIFGAVIDENMRDTIRITVIATGFERQSSLSPRPVPKPAMVDRRASSPQPARQQMQQPQQQPAQPAPAPSPLRQPIPPQSNEPRQQAAPPPPAPAQRPETPSTSGNAYSSDDLDIPTFLRKR